MGITLQSNRGYSQDYHVELHALLYLRKAYKGGTTDTLGPSQVPPPALPFCYASPSRAYSPPSHQASLTIAIIHLYSCAERDAVELLYRRS